MERKKLEDLGNSDLWTALQSSWLEAYPDKKRTTKQQQAAEFWKKNKKNKQLVIMKITQLKWDLKPVNRLKALFGKAISKSLNETPRSSSEQTEEFNDGIPPITDDSTTEGNSQNELEIFEELVDEPKRKPRSTTAQDKIKNHIEQLQTTIADLIKDTGVLDSSTRSELKQLKASLKKQQTKLRHLKSNQKASAKHRNKVRKVIKAVANNPDVSSSVELPKIQDHPGRPCIEEDHPLLLETIVNMVIQNSSTQERRRNEMLRTCRTLNDLHEELLNKGYTLSRSALYFRLLPHKSNTNSGKRHVTTVPVKLARAQNSLRKNNEDSHFAAASVKHVRDLAKIMGQKSVVIISQDDKSRVPLGLAAAHLQSPILMHMEYKVTLPDHDWVVASRHKLIPSVYAGLTFTVSGEIGYSGPTYIAIRSGKHDKSTAASHSRDLKEILYSDQFSSLTKTETDEIKPILIIQVDGGPDENPRFPKTLKHAVENFLQYNLDAVFVVTYAPGQSAYNPVERRMAPLSRDLAGLILNHQELGMHLDRNGKTIDCELEQRNFKKAGEVLAEVWNGNIIDGYPVIAEYIQPSSPAGTDTNGTDNAGEMAESWKAVHVRQSHYLLQVVKCENNLCCSPFRTNLNQILPGCFLPVPIPFKKTSQGIVVAELKDVNSSNVSFGDLTQRLMFQNLVPTTNEFKILPYDYFCPSVRSKLLEKYCKICFLSFPTEVALKSHRTTHSQSGKNIIFVTFSQAVSEEEQTESETVLSDDCHVIHDINQWNEPLFVLDDPEVECTEIDHSN